MLATEVDNFFEKLKENWKRKKIKAAMPIEIKESLIKECDSHYSLNNWLSYASNGAIKRALSSHPSKFTHPDVGASDTNIKKKTYVSPVIHLGNFENNGFLKTGNVIGINLDSTGNGAEVGSIGEIGAFLSLTLADGKRFFEHLREDSEQARKILSYCTEPYGDLKVGLLAMIKDVEAQTSSKIKQVYFPVDDDYHQLSLLTNSGIVYQLRSRLDKLRFSDEVKERRDKKRKNEFSEQDFSEIYGLTTIGYGGTKPQNISVLNNQNGGKAHLLSSLPPSIEKRSIHFPKSDFFTESFKKYEYADAFKALHKLFQTDYNNIKLRDARDRNLQQIIDLLIEKMWSVRAVSQAQFHADTSSLSSVQRTWLHDDFADDREKSEQWLNSLTTEISAWLTRSYEKVLDKKAIKLGDAERFHFAEVIERNREFLK
ncbi:type I-F CRISPR-associated protein Csy1 [Pseudoalteromonas neustonica]|uniref:CRISPR-associated protein Csy1 n=2 Tax=Pseudoalteromonas TaxID=53246 RepID=A0A0N1EUK6_9GAMM|nr:type I-F CRISPR-associated protein Csy1 [Pseudoalteromonas porphyrae]KPH63434.1 CRISPR-associated protein Csy1 [Pseudoalteromonas porphyrae]